MNYDTEQKVKTHVAAFVASLNGRFREHCSDTMLVSLLMNELRTDNRGAAVLAGDMNAAYDAAQPIFENVLEHGCGVICNGHHVAQSFYSAMESALANTQGDPARKAERL